MAEQAFLHRAPASVRPMTVPAPGPLSACQVDACPAAMVAAVILTHNRCTLLARCLAAVLAQLPPPALVLVVDNASTDGTVALMQAQAARYPEVVRHIRSERNLGAAGGYALGVSRALAEAVVGWVWMMDDDGWPADALCLGRLMRTARCHGAGLAAPLVLDADAPERLAFPVRRGGRTLFGAAEVAALGLITGFAHLFNGALVARETFERVGLPDARLVMRGDEVEFLHRARRGKVGVVLDTRACFLHPGSAPEIHPILFGCFYAVVPLTTEKRFYTFRNRGYVFSLYGRWGLLAADAVRYGWYYMINRRFDLRGYGRWVAHTWRGVRGDLRRQEASSPMAAHADIFTREEALQSELDGIDGVPDASCIADLTCGTSTIATDHAPAEELLKAAKRLDATAR